MSLKFYILHHVSNYCVLLDYIAYPMMIELKPVEYETVFTRSKYLGRKITDEMKIQIKKIGASYNFFNFVRILLYNTLMN